MIHSKHSDGMKRKLVVLTGAGMSAESGFATFRDSGGLWETHPVERVATPEGGLLTPTMSMASTTACVDS